MATILIVDDDIGLREGLAETITDFGHKPRAVSSGREALGIVEHQSVDGILLDLRMPGGIDGIEVLRRIRVQQNPPPVVVLTAFASAENTIEAMRLGAFDHLTKPIGRQELKAVLDRMFARRSASTADPQISLGDGSLIGSSTAMRGVQKTIGLAADSDATIL